MNVLKILILILVGLCSVLAMAQDSEKCIICYMNNWSSYRSGIGKFQPEDVDTSLCTHVIYSFANIDESGHIKLFDTWMDLSNNYIRRTTDLKTKNPNLKVLIAIGGWNAGSKIFSNMAADPLKVQNFKNSSIEFMETYGFDGLDMDWEYPSQRGGRKEDNKNFVKLLEILRKEFDKKAKLLTVAVGASPTMITKIYDVSSISKYAHYINLMTYDYNAYWSNQVGHNAPLGDVKKSVESWIENGADPKKITLGIASYGQTFKIKANAGCKVGTPAIGPGTQGPFTKQSGMQAYYEFCSMFGDWSLTYDRDASVPMLESSTNCISFDDGYSIRQKGKLVNEMGLGGMMTWSLDFDDFRGLCGIKFPLLKAMNDVMGYSQVEENPSKPTTTKPVTSKPNTAKPSPPQDKGKCTHNELYPHEFDCTLFYQCNHGTLVVMNCPDGLHFDDLLKVCNYEEHANCKT